MRLSTWMAGVALAAVAGTAAAQSAPSSAGPLDPQLSASNIRAHMAFLADDLLEGRDTGARGYDIAAKYVASQLQQLGAKPAGDSGSYFQKVTFTAVKPADKGTFVLRGRGGQAVTLSGDEVLIGKNVGPAERKISAPLVFVGYGLDAPEIGHEDFKGIDVKGKIVVVLQGAPMGIQSEQRAHYSSLRTKRAAAAARGAVGVISVYKPSDEKRRPFERYARTWDHWSMSWKRPDGTPFDVAPTVPSIGLVSVAAAPKLFAGAPTSYEKIIAAAESGKGKTPRFALPMSLDATLRYETKEVVSHNVAGLIEGSDPKLKDEVIVLSAHLDHEGLAETGEDKVYNGALDNASGIATTLEVARAFRESGKPPRRSVMILAVTAEEKGLLGSEYFAKNPTVPASSIVANVNLDMPILYYDFHDVIAFGANRSTIGPAVQRAGARMGVELSEDPLPQEGLFTRSDHYRFVEAGVPSIFLMTGFKNGGEKQFTGFLSGCYHQVCDDLSQPIDYAAGAKFARINYEIARELADADQRPAWNPGDFFGTKFGKK